MDRRFVRLWCATGISNLGDGLRIAALPLLATRLTNDPRLIAGVAIAERLPWLAFILPGGALADRFDRRRLRAALDAVRALVMGGLASLVATGNGSIAALAPRIGRLGPLRWILGITTVITGVSHLVVSATSALPLAMMWALGDGMTRSGTSSRSRCDNERFPTISSGASERRIGSSSTSTCRSARSSAA